MGNNCDADNICTYLDDNSGVDRRNSLASHGNGIKFTQKDLIQVKKYEISKDYIVLNPPIGKGSFGSVYKIINRKSGMVWAAKKISLAPHMSKQIQEICILKQLDHPNIVRIIDIFEEQLFVYVVMQYCHGGQLFERITERQNMTQDVAKVFMKQLLSAIAYCHSNRIIHRDLKPQNIMLVSSKEDNLKIIDFGAGTFVKDGESNTLKVGSVYYIAPQVIKKNYNQKCDIWSIGVIMYMMLSGIPPFNGKTDKTIFDKILQGQYSFPEKKFQNVSREAQNLIQKMLQYNPQKRISARQALSHPWFSKKTQQNLQTNLFLKNQLSAIKDFCQMNKFKECIVVFMTQNLCAAQTLGKMSKRFRKIDKNGDGRISLIEFERCYREYLPETDLETQRHLFQRLDKNDSGYIDYSQFIASMASSQLLENKQMIQKAFDLIDVNKDGKLEKKQIITALGGIEESLYQQIMRQCDTNGDGYISCEEFMAGILTISENKVQNHKHKVTKTRAETGTKIGSI